MSYRSRTHTSRPPRNIHVTSSTDVYPVPRARASLHTPHAIPHQSWGTGVVTPCFFSAAHRGSLLQKSRFICTAPRGLARGRVADWRAAKPRVERQTAIARSKVDCAVLLDLYLFVRACGFFTRSWTTRWALLRSDTRCSATVVDRWAVPSPNRRSFKGRVAGS